MKLFHIPYPFNNKFISVQHKVIRTVKIIVCIFRRQLKFMIAKRLYLHFILNHSKILIITLKHFTIKKELLAFIIILKKIY